MPLLFQNNKNNRITSVSILRIPLPSAARLLAVCSALLAAGQAFAQSAEPTTEENSTVTYPASYFAEFQPYSVNDMLERIPGITVALLANLMSAVVARSSTSYCWRRNPVPASLTSSIWTTTTTAKTSRAPRCR